MSEAYEFICTECKQRVVAVAGKEHATFDLCAPCVHMPGWYRNPRLAELYHYRPDPGSKP